MALVAVALTAYRLWPIDGIAGISARELTIYADGYSDAGWRSVGLGAKRRNVYAQLGPPASVVHIAGGHTLEEWTQAVMSPGRYRRRALGFHGDTVVFKKAEIARPRPRFNIVYPAGNPIFE
jgi:hypothetical protein